MTHKAIVVTEIGAPLVLQERPTPEPTENQILVKVSVAGLNPHDSFAHQWGLFIKDNLPSPLSIDIVGTVAKLGSKVTKYSIGDHVFGIGNPTIPDMKGTQEYAILEAKFSAKVPEGTSEDEAATLTLNPFTAYIALFHKQGLDLPAPYPDNKPDFDYAAQSLFVVGGGTACGKYIVQYAKYAGIGKIIITASLSSEKLLKSLGATHVIDRHLSDDEVDKHVRAIVGDDLIWAVDCKGRRPGEQTLGAKALSNTKKGTLTVLTNSGTVDETMIGEKKAGYERKPMIAFPFREPDASECYWQSLPQWIKEGTIKPTPFSVVEGLDETKINEVFNAYRDGKLLTKPQVHVRGA